MTQLRVGAIIFDAAKNNDSRWPFQLLRVFDSALSNIPQNFFSHPSDHYLSPGDFSLALARAVKQCMSKESSQRALPLPTKTTNHRTPIQRPKVPRHQQGASKTSTLSQKQFYFQTKTHTRPFIVLDHKTLAELL
jgi:hypothetical protein